MTKYRLGDVLTIIMDYRGKTPKKLGLDWTEDKNDIVALSAKNLKNGELINLDKSHYGNSALYNKWMKDGDISVGDILMTSEAPLGELFLVDKPIKAILSQRIFLLRPNNSIVLPWYLYFYMSSKNFQNRLNGHATGTTVIGIKQKELRNIEIELPSLSIQKSIVRKLVPISKKIEINKEINDNLLELNSTCFKKIFDTSNDYQPADSIADIKIGKTPPRKQSEWFSISSKDLTWVSIKDMKDNTAFISSSNENITLKAVDRFNINVVPKNTVILSFKLTIGRVKISNHELTTNEAIAQFQNSSLPWEFLYTYLKLFPYGTLGSTSSIAKAINSKIIKKMPVLVPNKSLMNQYLKLAIPIFNSLREIQEEQNKLRSVKQELLTKYF